MARATGRLGQFKYHQESTGEQMESIRECSLSEKGLENSDIGDVANRTAIIKIVLNVGTEYQSHELSFDCDKSIKNCNPRFRCSTAHLSESSTNGLGASQHRTVTKVINGRHQHRICGENQRIRQASSLGLLNYEQNISKNMPDGKSFECWDTIQCCESCTNSVTCYSNSTRYACLARSVAVASNGLAGERGNPLNTEAALFGRHLEQTADSGACACCPCKYTGLSRGEQVDNACLFKHSNHNNSYFCCEHNQASDLCTNLALIKKKDCSSVSSVDGSSIFKEHQEVSRRPYVTRINLTSENHQKESGRIFRSRSTSSSVDDMSKVELKKSCSQSYSTMDAKDLIESRMPYQTISSEKSKSHQSNLKDSTSLHTKVPQLHTGGFWWQISHSCFCNIIITSLLNLFPIFSAFENYSLPGDLLNDLVAGLTIAVLQIPQGMAYGLLAGVEPIYGLYVSFVPVLVMTLMSKSRHVSYGTFAMISMLLVSAIESVKLVFNQRIALQTALIKPLTVNSGKELSGLVVTDNHQPVDPSKQLLRNLILGQPQTANLESEDGITVPNLTLAENAVATLWPLMDASNFVMPTDIEILTTVCLLVGAIQVGMALFRLGILSLMFSQQLVSGFTVASALHVITSQLGPVLDIDLPHIPDCIFKICHTWWAFATKINEGFNQHTALLSFCSILFLMTIKELIEPPLRRRCKSITCLPSELVLMSFVGFGSWYWKFEEDYNIKIVGNVPTGLPGPKMPRLDVAPLVIYESLTIALVSFALNISLVKIYAKRYDYSINPNQELFALGTSNLVGCFFSCFPCASSLSRSSVQSSLNPKSQLCSLFSCLMVVSIICHFAPVLHDLPRSTLSCIIIVALKGILIQVKDLDDVWRSSKMDIFVWVVTFSSVFALGITYGLVVGIIASLSVVLFKSCNKVVIQ